MTQPTSETSSSETSTLKPSTPAEPTENLGEAKSEDAFVKLAMRNMVSKGAKSLKHFGLTLIGLLTIFVGLAYLTR